MTRRTSKYAQTTIRSAPLSGEFGLSYATRLFGEEAIASLPTLKSGPNKGKIKGFVIWMRTTTAGYHPNAGTFVKEDTTVRAWIGASESSSEVMALTGKWMGRSQSLCGSRSVLTEAYRQQDARERAERERMWAEEKAELLAERH